MPAAAVIPAPLAYIKVAAVKKLVVGSRDRTSSVFVWPCLERGRGLAGPAGSHPDGLWYLPGFYRLWWPAVASGRVSLIGCLLSDVTLLP